MHTEANGFSAYKDLLLGNNDDWLDATSLQVHGENIGPNPDNTVTHEASTSYSYFAQQARKLFQNHPNGQRTVVVDIDENGGGWRGAAPLGWADPQNPWVEANRDDRRRRILYDVLFAGANLSWYLGNFTEAQGGGDISLERFDTRDELFDDTRWARRLMEMPNFSGQSGLFVTMQPWDEIMAQGGTGSGQLFTSPLPGFHPTQDTEGLDTGAYDGEYRPRVFAMIDGRVLVHYPHLAAFGPYTLDLSLVRSATPPSSYTSYWYNPRTGGLVLPRTVITTNFSSHIPPLPAVTLNSHEDWVYVIEVN